MMCPDWSGGQIAVVAATVAIRASSVSASFGEIEISEFHECKHEFKLYLLADNIF